MNTAVFLTSFAPFAAGCLVKSVILLGSVLAIVACIRRLSSSIKHCVLLLTLTGFAALPILQVMLPTWNLHVFSPKAANSPTPSAQIDATYAPPIQSVPVEPAQVKPKPAVEPSVPMATVESEPVIQPTVSKSNLPKPIGFELPSVLLAFWFAGCLMLVARQISNALRLRHLVKVCRPVDIQQSAGLSEAVSNLPAGKLPRIFESEKSESLASPITWGAFKPVIVLPQGWREWTPNQLRSVLLHEIAHIERGDWAAQMLGYFVRAVYWPNPLIWLAVRLLRKEGENACDDAVLSVGVRPSEYAEHLVYIARQIEMRRRRLDATLSMARSARVESRLQSILASGRSRKPVTRKASASVGAVLIICFALIAAVRLSAQPSDSTDAYTLPPAPSHQPLTEPQPPVGASGNRLAPGINVAGEPRLATPASNFASPNAPIVWGKKVHGVQGGLALITPPDQVRIGCKIEFKTYLRNTTDHAISLTTLPYEDKYPWKATSIGGNTYRLERMSTDMVTTAMSDALPAGEIKEIRGTAPTLLLGPVRGSQEDLLEGSIIPNNYIRVKPGRFQITAIPMRAVARDDSWLNEVFSGKVTINVLPSAAKTASMMGISWGPAVDGLQTGVRLEKPGGRYAIGEAIWQEIYVRNRGTQTVKINYNGGYEDQGRPTITDSRGQNVRIQQYFGMGAMFVSESAPIRPGEIAMVGRVLLAFTGEPFNETTDKEPAPGISFSADGLPMAFAGAGKYTIRQTAYPVADKETKTVTSGPVTVEITSNRVPFQRHDPNVIADVKTAPIAWGQPSHGLRIGLIYLNGKTHYAIGERARIAIVLQNVGDKTVNFWHDTAFASAESPTVRDARGTRYAVKLSPEEEWKPFNQVRMTGVTFDMTFAPSAGGQSRIRQSELRPGGYVMGYFLSSFIVPANLTKASGSLKVSQEWMIGLNDNGVLDTPLKTGALPLTVFDGSGRPETTNAALRDSNLTRSGLRLAGLPEEPSGTSWGPIVDGLQAGIVPHGGYVPHTTGEQLWLDLLIRNATNHDIAFSWSTGSIYIDPPISVTGKRGYFQVIGGNSQIVKPFKRTLKPGELVLIGSPNYLLLPPYQFEGRASSPYPELRAQAGNYRIRQDFPVEIAGQKRLLSSGTVNLNLVAHKAEIAWGAVIDGVQTGLGFQEDKTKYAIGDTVGLYLYVRNVSGKRMKLLYHNNGDSPTLQARDSTGTQVTVNSVMNTLLPFQHGLDLKPGEISIISSPEIEIGATTKALGFQRHAMAVPPGRYTLKCNRITDFMKNDSFPRDGEIPTGSLAFQVVRQ